MKTLKELRKELSDEWQKPKAKNAIKKKKPARDYGKIKNLHTAINALK